MPRVPGTQPETKIIEALSNQTIASALGSDTDGADIDRDDHAYPDVVKVIATGNKLGDPADDLQLEVQDAADNGSGSPNTYADTGDTINVVNGDTFKTAEVSLQGKRRHVRISLSSGDSTLNTDAELAVVFVFGDLDVQPQ